MILVHKPGSEWVRWPGAPNVDPFRVAQLLAGGVWTEGDLDPYGVVEAIPFTVPDGLRTVGPERFEEADGIPLQAFDVEEMPVPVPEAISPLQARRALRAAGIKAAVDAYVGTLSEEAQEAWEYAVEIRRDNEIIAAGAAALELTGSQVDDLFRLGAML